ncbi:MAG: hypothetical protein ACOVOQ_11770 [Flavobacterium sp.]
MAIVPNDTRFIGINPTVDLRERRSARINRETQPHTMQDITDSIRPYKVFTALLTQNGGNEALTTLSGQLTVGVTYKLGTIQGNDDFTNVGAPANEFGISFVATGTTPANWESETELEYNTGAPVATVLENTIGNIWFTYYGIGSYRCESDNLFTIDKTTVFISDTINKTNPTGRLELRVLCAPDAQAQPAFLSIFTGTVSGAEENDIISDNDPSQYAVSFEIRVYN